LRRIILAVLFIWFIGQSMSEEPLEKTSLQVLFNYEDSVSGNGNFASSYKVITQGVHTDPRDSSRLSPVYLHKMDYGSGSIEKEMIMRSDRKSNETSCPDYNYRYALVNVLANSSMTYGPQTMSIDNGYYLAHPVNFNSHLSDMIQIKNYASQTSMVKETKYANAINMELLARIEDDHLDTGGSHSKGLASNLMNLNESVISGTAHIGMLQGNFNMLDYGKNAWSKPDINVDEVYTGTFNFATKMNLTRPVVKRVDDDDWMPCCYGGYLDMPIYYQKGSKGFGSDVKDIFDCTCPKMVGGA